MDKKKCIYCGEEFSAPIGFVWCEACQEDKNRKLLPGYKDFNKGEKIMDPKKAIEDLKEEELKKRVVEDFLKDGGDPNMVKPPLGIMPERIWREMRVQDLFRAIRERTSDELIDVWADELIRLFREILG